MYLLYYEQNRQCTYNVPRNMWCVRAAIVAIENNKYYIFLKCVFVALVTQRPVCMRPTVICGLSVSTIFFTLINSTNFDKCFWT